MLRAVSLKSLAAYISEGFSRIHTLPRVWMQDLVVGDQCASSVLQELANEVMAFCNDGQSRQKPAVPDATLPQVLSGKTEV